MDKIDFVKFLKVMFNDLDDIRDGTDEEVEAELKEMGIDLAEAEKSFYNTIKKCKKVIEE